MARYEPIEHALRDGRRITIRSADRADGRAMLDFAERMMPHAPYLLTQWDEVSKDLAPQVERIGSHLDDPNALFLIAEHEDRIVADTNFKVGHRRRIGHTGELGIGIVPEFRGVGLGRLMMETLLGWAAAHPTIRTLRLGCYAANTNALRLYESLGFRQEGVRRAFFRHEDGTFHDDIVMAVWVKPEGVPPGFVMWTPG